jgi:hypothetical protein
MRVELHEMLSDRGLDHDPGSKLLRAMDVLDGGFVPGLNNAVETYVKGRGALVGYVCRVQWAFPGEGVGRTDPTCKVYLYPVSEATGEGE